MLRTFLAVPLDETSRAAVSAYLASLGPLPGRLVAPADWHITLVFLGEVDASRLAQLEEALDRTRLGERFHLELLGVRAFPDETEGRILWLEPGGDLGRLAALHGAVRAVTTECGFATDPRPFNPHLTIGRVSRPSDVSAHSIRPPAAIALPVREIALFRRVSADSPAYAVIRRWPLGKGD